MRKARLYRRSLCSLILAELLMVSPASPADPPLGCTDTEAVIVFGNGILDDAVGRFISLETLRQTVRAAVPSERYEKLTFEAAVNPSGGFFADIFEAAIQDLTTDVTQIWEYLLGIVPMPDSLSTTIQSIIANIDTSALVLTDSLQNHVNRYRTIILEGKKVVLVAHSQGTFYANQGYALLNTTERSSFGIVAVAEMDSFVAGGGTYTSLLEDLVVLAVTAAKARLHLPGPLPPTTTNFGIADLPLNHNFVSAYLLGSNSRPRISSQIMGALDGLATPAGNGGDGIITVTLTWGAEPDVDLHTYEPNGTHVYYANRLGISGYLDVDDVTSFGPEHYYVGCDTLETGNYAIGVNYYHGSAPEVAHVQIKAGGIIRSFDTFLPVALGASGDNTPIPVGRVVVTGNATDGFSFAVE